MVRPEERFLAGVAQSWLKGRNLVTPDPALLQHWRKKRGPPLIPHAAKNPGGDRSKVFRLLVTSFLSFAGNFGGLIRVRLLGYREVFFRPSRFAPEVA